MVSFADHSELAPVKLHFCFEAFRVSATDWILLIFHQMGFEDFKVRTLFPFRPLCGSFVEVRGRHVRGPGRWQAVSS